MEALLKNEWVKVVGVVFMAGVFYMRVQHIETHLNTVEDRLSKKIKVQHELQERIRELEKCN